MRRLQAVEGNSQEAHLRINGIENRLLVLEDKQPETVFTDPASGFDGQDITYGTD
jgi:hypothetical protein